jgi:hypothetical protein
MARRKSPAKQPQPISADEAVADLIGHKVRNFERAKKRRKSEAWFPLHMPESGDAFAVCWFGDPHLDDDNCDWPTLLDDISRVAETPGMYGACIGDLTNNWVGRLARLYGDQQSTRKEARQLARWFLRDCGVDWRLCTLGNHDEWNEGEAIMGMIADECCYMPFWEARVEIRDGAGGKWRVHAAHDFRGTSIYNGTHGPSRAAMFSGGAAELYVCGHKHFVGSQGFEIAENGTFVRAIRARGYKAHDRHATVNGFPQGQLGHSVVTIFNPRARTAAGRIIVCEDVATGCDVLTALRG